MAIIAHYLNRGHTLDELMGLGPLEMLFFRCARDLELEYVREVVMEVLGIGRPK